jgi:hypothetical protein
LRLSFGQQVSIERCRRNPRSAVVHLSRDHSEHKGHEEVVWFTAMLKDKGGSYLVFGCSLHWIGRRR